MRKILVSNDDGITADGIARLASVAKRFGEVWVVSPDRQYSAMSHAAMFWDPLTVTECDFPIEGVHAFSASGTPSDCVYLGINAIVPGGPDVVFCGINQGINVGKDVQYSGTIGAAMEAASRSILTIAVSEDDCRNHGITDRYLEQLIGELIDEPLKKNEIWNINFPSGSSEEGKGVLYDRTLSSDDVYAGGCRVISQDGNTTVYKCGSERGCNEPEGTDYGAIVSGYVSVGKVRNYSC
ncbi:MAG: 5'/3'-nucleotidase SurE [Saccharofermentans sp.]|nr:5'/3'-nucleotidase SurE [Saccharofermentans sp.]